MSIMVFLCHRGRREECQKKKLHSSFSLLRVKGSDLLLQRFESVINHNLGHMKQSSGNLLQAFSC